MWENPHTCNRTLCYQEIASTGPFRRTCLLALNLLECRPPTRQPHLLDRIETARRFRLRTRSGDAIPRFRHARRPMKYYHNFCIVFLAASFFGCHREQADHVKEIVRQDDSQKPEIDRLLKDLGVTWDLLHSDTSDSVSRLIDLGETSVDRCLEIYASDCDELRMDQAATVIVMYTARRFGFKSGFGFPDDGSETKWKQYLESHGSLDHHSTLSQRRAVEKGWMNWRVDLPKDTSSK